jgi:hypothetical protein
MSSTWTTPDGPSVLAASVVVQVDDIGVAAPRRVVVLAEVRPGDDETLAVARVHRTSGKALTRHIQAPVDPVPPGTEEAPISYIMSSSA